MWKCPIHFRIWGCCKPSKCVHGEVLEEAQRVKPLKALTILFIKLLTTHKFYLTKSTIALLLNSLDKKLDISDSYQIFPKTQKLLSVIPQCPTTISTTICLKSVYIHFLFMVENISSVNKFTNTFPPPLQKTNKQTNKQTNKNKKKTCLLKYLIHCLVSFVILFPYSS